MCSISLLQVFLSKWQVVLPKREAHNKLHSCTQYGTVQHYTNRFLDILGKLPNISNDEALDGYIRGC